MKLSGARRYKQILMLVIIILTGLLVIAFVRFRMQSRPVEKPDAPENSTATLSINGFRHTATREGRTSWILEAATAKLYSDENQAMMSDVEMRFFPEDQSKVQMTANKGQFNTRTRNMSVSGSVVCRYSGYVLNTENLHYQHESNIIYTETEIAVNGQNMQVTADSGEFEIDTGTLRLSGHVEAQVRQIDKD